MNLWEKELEFGYNKKTSHYSYLEIVLDFNYDSTNK